MLKKNVLLAGESWSTFSTHTKGFDSFYNAKYEEGGEWLIQALEKAGYKVDFLPNHRAAKEFPDSEEKINEYDVIILSDIGSNTLLLHPDTFEKSIPTVNKLKLIKRFVENGGGFLMIGGYMSFQGIDGKARYKNTPIEEILPVIMKEVDDRVELPEGMQAKVVAKHKITENLDKKWPIFFGYNQFKADENGIVLAENEENKDPILVIGEFNQGRTAAFASDCAPHWGSKYFIEWDQYDSLWSQLIEWLAGDNN